LWITGAFSGKGVGMNPPEVRYAVNRGKEKSQGKNYQLGEWIVFICGRQRFCEVRRIR
jgi:hypothetical protein